jgi:NAD(P)-dependent dehydrogenase (short-subunit alcohol dehydrogenase family)
LYVASKSAVEAMTRVQAKELGPRKIRVNAISCQIASKSDPLFASN